MVVQLNRHDIKWLSPSPMWDTFGDISSDDLSGEARRRCFNRPAILRFKNDNFMDELLALMSDYPDKLSEWQVRPETWREPMAAPATAAKLSLAEPFSQLSTRQVRESNALKNISAALPVDDSTDSVDCEIKQDPDKPLKLYQPAQQRFYLVAASLVCRRSGLPDRVIDSAKQQQSGFVLRRLISREAKGIKTPDTCDLKKCDEYALVQTVNGMQWRNISQHSVLSVDHGVPDEERLPMFSIGFNDLDNRKRRLLSGFIPVGKREAYLGAEQFDEAAEQAKQAASSTATTDTSVLSERDREALKQLFEMQVSGPWKALIEQAENERQKAIESLLQRNSNLPPIVSDLTKPASGSDASYINNIKISREQVQTNSWYVLLDLMHFLERYLNDVYQVIAGTKTFAELSRDEERDFYNALNSVVMNAGLKTELVSTGYHSTTQVSNSLLQALQTLINTSSIETGLEAVDVDYDHAVNTDSRWPAFIFPLADPELSAPLPALSIENTISGEPDVSVAKVDELSKLLALALPDSLQVNAPETVVLKEQQMDNGDGWFVIRCIYEQPNCGPFFPAVLSQPTEAFKMASFFDPDAPGRDIRIPMPLDISPSGLRKFNKNTTLMISDMLCGKIRNIRKITFGDLVLSVLPWPFHKDLPSTSEPGPCKKSSGNTFGMFCSLSIPIVTLCALILLIIMVTLFDIFFRWLPLLFTCFPIPGLKGKKS